MKRKIIIMVLAISLFIPISYVSASDNAYSFDEVSTNELLDDKDYKSDELIVVFNDNLSNKTINNIVRNENATVKNIKRLDDDSVSVRVKISDDMETAIDSFKDNPRVAFVQPNYKYKVNSDASVYNNPNYQYHIDLIKTKEAWSLVESKGNTTKVSVIDTGVDVKHEDLQKNLVSNSSYTQTVGGIKKQVVYDSDHHGTHVTGIIGATYGNGIGVSGVASGNNNNLAKIMVVGTSFDGENMYTSDIIDAINYSKDNGAKVINMSFGGTGRDRAMEAAIRDAYDNGIVLVAASGNDESNEFSSPSDFKEVISVNASNKYNKPVYWSDYGISKDISAPGYNILSTTPGNTYKLLSGTSMASPIVAGVVALMLDANPSLTPAEVYNILCASTGQSDFDEMLGYGIVNAKEAVSAAIDASSSVDVDSVSIKDYDASYSADYDAVVYENDDISLEALVRPATSLKKVEWSSSDDSIAKVDSVTGRVTGVKSGFVTITASVSGKSDSVLVKVKESLSQTGISIVSKEDYSSIVKGSSYELKANISPSNATNKEVYWSSSNRTVADINELGILTGKSSGKTTITVKTYDGKYYDSFDVIVTSPASVKLTKYASKLLVGNKYTYNGYVLDIDGKKTNDKIIWSSTNANIAKIDSNGTVTALKPGTTYIVGTVKGTDQGNRLVKVAYRLFVGKTNYALGDYNLKVRKVTYNSVTLNWNKINVASKYIVERAMSSKGSYVKIGEVTGTSYKDSNVVLGKRYYYRIKAVYSSTKSFSYSYSVNALVSLDKPVISVTNYKSRYLKISINKVPGARGYTIYRASSVNGSYKVVTSTTKNYYINGKLVKNKRYYYKVRAYKVVNGKKVYSPYSSIKSRVVR